jgi:signal transduction histidine kinase
MRLRAWLNRLGVGNKASSAEVGSFPVAAFWRTICSLKQPVLLVKDGFQIIAATDEAHELLGSRNANEIALLLKEGLDPHTLSRIQMAIANPVAMVTELPLRLHTTGLLVTANVTVSTLPEYPELHAALLFLKDTRNPAIPSWVQTSRDLLGKLSLPAWVVAADGSVAFSNAAFSEFPLEAIRAKAGERESVPHLTRLLENLVTQPAQVRSSQVLTDETYALGHFGKWRVLHFPMRSRVGERMVGVVAMPLAQPRQSRSKIDRDAATHPGAAVLGQDALTQVLQVREAERTALAREIHDSLGQELTVVKLELARLYNMVVGTGIGTQLMTEHFQSVRQLVDNVAKTARRIAYEMRQDLATVQGLSHTVQQMVQDLRGRMGMQIQFELLPGWIEPEKGMARHIHRCLQELLNNVSKHAKADRCLVRMGFSASTYWLEVRDDGVGMPADSSNSSIGLRSLKERAEIYGGLVRTQTRPDVGGTFVRLEFPERRSSPLQNSGAMALGNES